MANCKPTPEAEDLIRRMARSRMAAGLRDPESIVDAIHHEIGEHAQLWKSEIADIVKAETTRSRPNVQRQAQLRRNMEDLRGVKAEAERRTGTPGMGPPKKEGPKFEYDADTKKLMDERDALRAQVDSAIKRLEYANQSPAAKAADWLLATRRAIILSGTHTIGKLSSAALTRIISAPIEEAAGELYRHLPLIRTIAKQAPREGGGFSRAAEREALRQTFSKDTLKEMGEVIRTGHVGRTAKFKEEHFSPNEWQEVPGRIHAALKKPAERNEYFRSLVIRSTHARKDMKAKGFSDADIEKAMNDPVAQVGLQAQAFADSQRAIMMGPNMGADMVKGLIEAAGRQKGERAGAGQVAKRVLQYEMPIVRVPFNIAKEVGQYSLGHFAAGLRIGAALIGRRLDKLLPEEADAIMRNLKKGTVGSLMFTAGYMNPDLVGGYYQRGDEKTDQYAKLGTVTISDKVPLIGGVQIPKYLVHAPIMEMLQVGATFRRVASGIMTKKGQPRKGTGTAEAGALAAVKGVTENLPLLELPRQVDQVLHEPGAFFGTELSSFVPPDIGRAAKEGIKVPFGPTLYEGDTNFKGEPIRRKAHSFIEALKEPIPEVRKSIPASPGQE